MQYDTTRYEIQYDEIHYKMKLHDQIRYDTTHLDTIGEDDKDKDNPLQNNTT